MSALATAAIYFGSFLAIAVIAKLAVGRWLNMRDIELFRDPHAAWTEPPQIEPLSARHLAQGRSGLMRSADPNVSRRTPRSRRALSFDSRSIFGAQLALRYFQIVMGLQVHPKFRAITEVEA